MSYLLLLESRSFQLRSFHGSRNHTTPSMSSLRNKANLETCYEGSNSKYYQSTSAINRRPGEISNTRSSTLRCYPATIRYMARSTRELQPRWELPSERRGIISMSEMYLRKSSFIAHMRDVWSTIDFTRHSCRSRQS